MLETLPACQPEIILTRQMRAAIGMIVVSMVHVACQFHKVTQHLPFTLLVIVHSLSHPCYRGGNTGNAAVLTLCNMANAPERWRPAATAAPSGLARREAAIPMRKPTTHSLQRHSKTAGDHSMIHHIQPTPARGTQAQATLQILTSSLPSLHFCDIKLAFTHALAFNCPLDTTPYCH